MVKLLQLKDNGPPHVTKIIDDGFAITTAEPWVRHKVELVRQYITAFVTALASQVDEVVIVDLYARNGLYCLGTRKDTFPGIPLMALQLDLPISKFVFCESDEELLRALKIRANKYFRSKNIVLLKGKPEELIDKIKMYVPESRKNHKVATLCIADAFGLEPGLDTMRQLSEHDFSFLVPLTFHLGKKINHQFYLNQDKDKIKHLLGYETTAEGLGWKPESNTLFYRQLIQRWEQKVEEIGLNAAVSTHKLDSGLMEMSTYSICLFSRKYSAKAIQLDALAGSHIQFALFNHN